MSTANKLAYLGVTKSKIKDVINMAGVGITNDTFRSYAQSLYDGYIATLQDKGTLLDNMNKGTSTGTISGSANLPVYEYKASKLSTQETTTGKNLANIHNIDDISASSYKLNIVGDTIVLKDNANVIGFTQTNKTLAELCPSLQVGDSVTLSFKNTSSSGSKDRIYLYGVNSAWYLSSPTKTITQDMLDSYVVLYGGHDETAVISEFMISKIGGAYEPYTFGASPNPSYPQEVNTVKGYRNLFSGDFSQFNSEGGTGTTYGYFKLPDDNEIYTLALIAKNNYTVPSNTYLGFTGNGGNASDGFSWIISQGMTITAGEIKSYSTKNLRFISIYANNSTTLETIKNNFYIQLVKGEYKPYVPYGTNYIYTTISDGTNSKIITIPLNDNEICGIGDYKDELVIDKLGNAKITKKIGKAVLNGSETYTGMTWPSGKYGYSVSIIDIKQTTSLSDISLLFSNYYKAYSQNGLYGLDVGNYGIANRQNQSEIIIRNDDCLTSTDLKNWLSTHNTDVYYVLDTPQLIDLNYTVNMELYDGTNNITNSENMDMAIKYVKNVYE